MGMLSYLFFKKHFQKFFQGVNNNERYQKNCRIYQFLQVKMDWHDLILPMFIVTCRKNLSKIKASKTFKQKFQIKTSALKYSKAHIKVLNSWIYCWQWTKTCIWQLKLDLNKYVFLFLNHFFCKWKVSMDTFILWYDINSIR